ncbi:hypothetical protein MSPP1_001261 [Malassezia sp. CBS 17886]|nr:hypothetical protein MSPP1_001261 [Malassezia sp. CBS 17886]
MARAEEAFQRACGPAARAGGAAGQTDTAMLHVARLPEALRDAGLVGALLHGARELLQEHAEYVDASDKSLGKGVRRDDFLQAVAVAREGSAGDDAAEDGDADSAYDGADSSEHDESDEYAPDGASEDEGGFVRTRRPGMRRAPAGRTRAAVPQATFLFRLLLQRIPLTPTLPPRTKQPLRTDVSDDEVAARRIGLDELRYAMGTLGTSVSRAEIHEMLAEASAYFPDEDVTEQDPRIGIDEFSDLVQRVGIA